MEVSTLYEQRVFRPLEILLVNNFPCFSDYESKTADEKIRRGKLPEYFVANRNANMPRKLVIVFGNQQAWDEVVKVLDTSEYKDGCKRIVKNLTNRGIDVEHYRFQNGTPGEVVATLILTTVQTRSKRNS